MAVLEIRATLIVIDSSTWVDFFNDVSSPHADRLETALVEEEDIAVIPIIVTEVLQGFRSFESFDRARNLMTRLPVLVPDLQCYVDAALLCRSLRSRGITVRGAVDCIIARICIVSGSTLLSPDSDFRLIADHTKLDLWMPI